MRQQLKIVRLCRKHQGRELVVWIFGLRGVPEWIRGARRPGACVYYSRLHFEAVQRHQRCLRLSGGHGGRGPQRFVWMLAVPWLPIVRKLRPWLHAQ
jgi:hypothetical protein